MTEEEKRLREFEAHKAEWKHWGPYLGERNWGTVREDYSADGNAWNYFSHEQSRSRAYRWGEDGILGICDNRQLLCFALAFWNGKDPILKERMFGLTNEEGNHGEDVKEYWFYLDSTPTHSYMKALYKYPQAAFPYNDLVQENRRRGVHAPEYELIDTGIFEENRYFDIYVEYAKADPEDIVIAITAVNRGPESAPLHLLPTLWFKNTWSWEPCEQRPSLTRLAPEPAQGVGGVIEAKHPSLGTRWLLCHADGNSGPELLFTENNTNNALLFPPEGKNETPYVKDGFHDYIIHGKKEAVNPANTGTKAAAHYFYQMEPGESRTIRLRLTTQRDETNALAAPFDSVLALRKQEADAFYATVAPEKLTEDAKRIQRQALAGMLWSKQFYNYAVLDWLKGDSKQPPPPDSRWNGRNHDWTHLVNDSVLAMPDTWEYPWYAAWDMAFHCVTFAIIDPDFAKRQLILLLREWFMHPNGQLPAYEWAFGDVNPPVHAWAALRVYQIERRLRGDGDTQFLERVFHKLLINFTWWVNRKDAEGRNVFQGGFLGLDNIGIFDRSKPLPFEGHLDQSDGTSWMAMYCLNLLAIALELARHDNTYEDVATKFLEHYFYIAHAMNDRPSARGDDGVDLWDKEDGFYYDVLHMKDDSHQFIKLRSMVGLIPLFAIETLEPDLLKLLPDFARRLDWFLTNKPELCRNVASVTVTGEGNRRLFSVVDEQRLRTILTRALDETEFLSAYGIRSLSRYYKDKPYKENISGMHYEVEYAPGNSQTTLFGGNSNWRGPIWFPLNYLLIEALQKLDHYYGAGFKIECPTGSGNQMTLWEVATELSHRLIRIFQPDANGRRPVAGEYEKFQTDPNWKDLILFHEFFHGDTGAGLGASHQTGWTGLIAKLIQQSGE